VTLLDGSIVLLADSAGNTAVHWLSRCMVKEPGMVSTRVKSLAVRSARRPAVSTHASPAWNVRRPNQTAVRLRMS
jgi:hypothetical protein